MTLRQIVCSLLRAHLPVTEYRKSSVQVKCYVCAKRLGDGWQTGDLKAPRHLVLKSKVLAIVTRKLVA